ncbi:dihydroorotate dehydrogenase [Coemansia sp. RSA 986]|nr:dihydroorotate dehydrogenase [Coemansia sp. RSA 986]
MFRTGFSRLTAHFQPAGQAAFARSVRNKSRLSRPVHSKTKFARPARGKSKDEEDPLSLVTGITWSVGIAAVFGFGLLYGMDSSSGLHKYVITPVLRLLDPEDAHNLVITVLRYGLGPMDDKPDDSLLEVSLWGKKMSNPVGLAAGFDKNGKAIDGLFSLGFGLVEVGSITPVAQEGNPKKRLFRIDESGAVINRMGMNNEGVEVCSDRIRSRFWRMATVQSKQMGVTVASLSNAMNKSAINRRLLGVNLGKNKSSSADSYDDYVLGLKSIGPYADYVVVNVSCPNVKNIAASSDIGVLESTIAAVVKERNSMPNYRPPVVLKIGPDNSADQLKLIAQLALDYNVDGIITTNTTSSRPSSIVNSSDIAKEEGGLSGKPLRDIALATTRDMYKLTKGRIPIIGCGGISSAEDALEFGKAGATAVQIYSSMIYDGPGKAREIKDGLVSLLKGRKWTDIVGEDAREYAARYGIPDYVIKQVDDTTLYMLVAVVEALLRAGITDPYELYKYFHVSEVGNSIGSAFGGLNALQSMFRLRSLEKNMQSDILEETFISAIQAWLNMLLMSSTGSVNPVVGACATRLLSIDVAQEINSHFGVCKPAPRSLDIGYRRRMIQMHLTTLDG